VDTLFSVAFNLNLQKGGAWAKAASNGDDGAERSEAEELPLARVREARPVRAFAFKI